MNPAPQHATRSPATGAAILVLGADGRVQIASAAACTLWQAKAGELVGDLFPNLFSFEIISQDPGLVHSQWEVLVSAAQDRAIPLKLQPKEAAEFDVLVRLEKAGGEPAQYLATIFLPALSGPAPAVAPAPPPA